MIAIPFRVKPGAEQYRHTTPVVEHPGRNTGRGGNTHFKWDEAGKGDHKAMCWTCRHVVSWSATGKIKK